MATPVAIGAAKIKVASVVQNRALVRFQNVGKKTVYIKKIPLNAVTVDVSDTDYEVLLHADPGESGKGDSFETNSINGFVAISTAAGSELAIYQTVYI